MEDYYFDGDPATDSTRRRLERVLREPERPKVIERSRWPWRSALVTGGTAFLWWQLLRRSRARNGSTPPDLARRTTP